MYFLRIFCVVCFLFCSLAAKAEPEYKGKVKAFYINKDGNVLLTLDNGSSQPSCAISSWKLNFKMTDPSAKEWVSMLLSTRATDTSITVGYLPNSDLAVNNGRCSIVYFYFN